MNSGQMLFTIFALALLSTTVLSLHTSFSNTDQVVMKSKLGITATSLASSIIEEASGKAFDQVTDENIATLTSQLTAPGSLGVETGEFYPDSINDFDDFNNLTLTQSFAQGGTFNIKCKVEYIDPSNPDVASAIATWHKKLTVQVASSAMTDTMKMQFIFSYWYFR
jgi:hypothetical protein